MGKKSDVVLPAREYAPLEARTDIVAWTKGREARAREEAIAIEMVKNLRDQVSWCQRKHPVTHYYDCAELVGKYLKLVRDPLRGVKLPGAASEE
ncbi:hypothetical protein NSK_003884 [Nannochloropsis salina CCMP1776]|uniref:Uncharacterized protein n=1 Tax=Nannochloropsis salina CCMP1776 TaxID=1027361 RepID=A0A4D9CZM3_9STRA|nr:hypothetical protein NGA_0273602 [Nannochloropsis gaditana CCMP526]EKU22702.1 hypothetical protein NGA_0273602 [Nannochloropsis gaditana CCMP526]TFJ84852.1 hypothetical protein NSK_003884 [Nannochloropsis salina CCMP1776]|eukprot:TFJ84852.1 hypothetical protein NSK_003884 [Nannochloropsis salina CCMP1776]